MNKAIRTSAVLGILILLLLASVGCSSQKSIDDLSKHLADVDARLTRLEQAEAQSLLELLIGIKIRPFWRKPQQTQVNVDRIARLRRNGNLTIGCGLTELAFRGRRKCMQRLLKPSSKRSEEHTSELQ